MCRKQGKTKDTKVQVSHVNIMSDVRQHAKRDETVTLSMLADKSGLCSHSHVQHYTFNTA